MIPFVFIRIDKNSNNHQYIRPETVKIVLLPCDSLRRSNIIINKGMPSEYIMQNVSLETTTEIITALDQLVVFKFEELSSTDA